MIAPIGNPGSEVNIRTNQVLEHIIRPAVDSLDYEAILASEIPESGIITNQILERLYESDLVIADLTDGNPNVFYELAVRHSVEKPYVQIIKKGGHPPFDVQIIRTIFYDTDLDSAAQARKEITEYVRNIEEQSTNVQTPISMFKGVQRLRQSGDADNPGMLEILPLIQTISSSANETRDEMQQIRRIVSSGGQRSSLAQVQRQVFLAMQSENTYAFVFLINAYSNRTPWLYELGMEAFRLAIAGSTGYAREIFEYLLELIDFTPSQNWGLKNPSELPMKLSELFERLVDRVQMDRYEQSDLPF